MPPRSFFEELIKLSIAQAPMARPNIDKRGRRITSSLSLAVPRESKQEAIASLNSTDNAGRYKRPVTKPVPLVNPFVKRSGFA